MPQVLQLMSTHAATTEFMLVYLEEAHASDEWPIYQLDEDIPQHKTLSERLGAARKFHADFCAGSDLHLLADSLTNEFNRELASWPFRFWVLERCPGGEGSVVGFKAMPKDCVYELEHLDLYLRAQKGVEE